MQERLGQLGWDDGWAAAWDTAVGGPIDHLRPGRVVRLDRGWSTVATGDAEPARVRNIGADVAVGDWVAVDSERVVHVLERRSAFVRRASFEGARAEKHVLAANVDVVMLLHALTSPPNPRRLERELVLAYDSGAEPVVVLSKADLVDDPARAVAEMREIALTATVVAVSARTGTGLDDIRALAAENRTLALLGASGVGKSTLVNALVGEDVQRTAVVREDQRGRHTTVAAELVHLPGGGWLVDTPGLRAVSLWWEGQGIERAFADVFDLMDHCRFRDCKHEQEPGCAVRAAIASGDLAPQRLESLRRLIDEQVRIEDEQRAKDRATDRRGVRRAR
jgi:ribosome biogenesis GTPase